MTKKMFLSQVVVQERPLSLQWLRIAAIKAVVVITYYMHDAFLSSNTWKELSSSYCWPFFYLAKHKDKAEFDFFNAVFYIPEDKFYIEWRPLGYCHNNNNGLSIFKDLLTSQVSSLGNAKCA